jgi:hypothetical protein
VAVETPAVGSYEVGSEAVAGTTSYNTPTVTVTSQGSTVTTGGPDLTVTWTYSQADGKAQERYRVIVDNGSSTVYYDSGYIISAATSHTFDAVVEGVPTDTTSSALRVTVQAIAQDVAQYGSDDQTFDIQWGVVTGTITAPADLAVLSTTSTTVTWTFADSRSKTQSGYQVRLLGAASGIELFTSGLVTSTDTSYAVPYTLSDSSSYTVELILYNSESVPSTADTHTISVVLDDAFAYPDVETVGTVYEVGMAGEGYMLYDNRDGAAGQFRYGRQTAGLQSQRFATGSTPFEQAVDRYSFGSMSDFRGGRGQSYADRGASIETAYLESEGVDPWTPGKLTLLHDMDQEFADTYANLRMTEVDGSLFVQTDADELTYRTTPGGASNVIDLSGIGLAAGGIIDLETDGKQWYICDGVSAWRGTTSAPSGSWSNVNLAVLGWGAGRMLGAYAAGTSTTPNRFTTLNDNGTEEVSGGRLTFPDDWTITSFASGSGYVWFAAYGGSRSEVWAWAAGSTDSPFLAYEYPLGENIQDMLWHEGQIVAVTHHDDNTLSLWRLIPNTDGTLTPFLVDDAYGSSSTAEVSIGAYGSKVYFSWPAMSTNSGVGVLDIASGGYSKSYITDTTGEVASVIPWRGKIALAVRGNGVWTEQDDYVTTGFLRTSNFDGGSNLSKVYDEISIRGEALGASESFAMSYSVDGGNSFVSLPAGTLNTAGQFAKSATLSKRANSLSVQVTLNGPGTSTPTVTLVSAKYHLLGLADTVLTLPIDCTDHVRGLNESELDDSGPGRGALRMRRLERLVQTRVTVQDIDWHDTRDTEVYELLSVEAVKWSVYNRALGKQQVRQVAVCTLRKETV